jgi:hypothetical protein
MCFRRNNAAAHPAKGMFAFGTKRVACSREAGR